MNALARGTAESATTPRRTPAPAQSTVVVGGLGAVGRMLRRELAEQLGDVASIDPREGLATADVTCPGPSERKRLEGADTVILAVPEPVAVEALAGLAPLLRPDSLLVETLSVKSRFAAALARRRPRFEVVGINPMFGPSLQMRGRTVAVIPHRAGERAQAFTTMLAERGANLTQLTPSAHDQATVALQALPHLVTLAYTQAVGRLGIDLDELVELAPPPASALLALAARIASGNPHVYSEIQEANPYAAAGRASLAAELARLSEACTNPEALQVVLEEVGASLDGLREPLLAAADHIVSRPISGNCSALG